MLDINLEMDPNAFPCQEAMEEALNQYIDGELPYLEQPVLFAHLASCDDCRRSLSAMMEFRRVSRRESLAVPAVVDDAFFKRLDQVKRRTRRVDRWMDRRPLWQRRTPISLRVASVAALVLFIAGLFVPQPAGEPVQRMLVEGVEERVVFAPVSRFYSEAVYVFYPGLTVEASKIEDPM